MKTNIIKAVFGLILTFSISGLCAQSPRIKLNQIVKDTISGSVLVSGADSNMVYSRNFYIGSDTSLVFYGTTIVAGSGGGGSFVTLPQLTDSLALYATKVQLSDSMATVLKQVATDLTLTGTGTGASPLKVDTSVIATVSALRDSLAGILTTVSTDVTLTGNGSIASPLKVDTTTYIATKGDLALKQDQLNGTGFVKATGTTISYDNSTYYLASNPNGYTSNTGTVTSVAATAGTGISISGSPITGAGTLTITNTAPDQTVSITGAGINSVSGTYPSFTITGTEVDGSTTNELQTISYNSGTNVLTLSNSGGTADLSDLDLVDSTRLLADSILVYYQNGSEIGRDTISGISGGGGGGGSGTVTSVDVSGGTTGLTTSGGPITTSGTITIAGTLDVDNGGTGATSFTSGQMLKGNGTSAIQAASNLREVADTVYVDKFLNVDTATLYVDAVNNYVGIGTDSIITVSGVNKGLHVAGWINVSDGSNQPGLQMQRDGINIGDWSVASLGGNLYTMQFKARNNNEIRFVDDSNNGLTIIDGGNVGIGTTSPTEKLDVDGKVRVRNLTGTGATDVFADATGVLGVSSDERLKTYEGEIENAINIVNNLYPKYYKWKDDPTRRDAGFYAQEVLNVFPEAVVPMDNDNFYGFNSRAVLALSVKAIQEQQTIIEQQATEIETLKTQIQLILNEIQILKNN